MENNNEILQIEDRRENYYRVSNRIFNQDLDVYEIGVYSILCRFANNKTTESYPSQQKIADMLKVSKRQVARAVKSLVEKKIIFKKTGGLGFSNKYYLIALPCDMETLVTDCHKGSDSQAQGVVTDRLPIKTKTINTKKKDLFMFEEFWKAYDYKKKRCDCEKAWCKLDIPTREIILKAVPNYVLNSPEKQYRMHPLKYLSKRCWEDEITPKFKNNKTTTFQDKYNEGLKILKKLDDAEKQDIPRQL
jgi:biotin operon repressor